MATLFERMVASGGVGPDPRVMVAVLFRVCGGCGCQVRLDAWQDGPLGCPDCRVNDETAKAKQESKAA